MLGKREWGDVKHSEAEEIQLYRDNPELFQWWPPMTWGIWWDEHSIQYSADLIVKEVSKSLNTYKTKHTCFLFGAELIFRKHVPSNIIRWQKL